jgi:hypothetical protein
MSSHLFNPYFELYLSLIEDLTRKQGERLTIETKDAPEELKDIVL